MQESKNLTSSGKPSTNGTSEAMKFKFNTVGREDAAETVYKPQVDPGMALKRTLIIVALIAFFVAVSYISWDRAGRFNPFNEGPHKEFTPPPRDMPN